MKNSWFYTLTVLTALTSYSLAGALQEAKISQIVNDVKIVEPQRGVRTAALQELIKNDLGVATGIQSRAELLFQDNTLTRLGAESFFTFKPGTRDMSLGRGSMLLQVPKNLGGARIRAASVTASITGTTIMVDHLPGARVKVVVLEGSLAIGVDAQPGKHVDLRAGKMVILAPDAKELPTPVDADLRKIVQTSPLVNPVLFQGKSKASVAALPSMDLIEKEIVRQRAQVPAANLAAASADESESDSKVAVVEAGAPAVSDIAVDQALASSVLTIAATVPVVPTTPTPTPTPTPTVTPTPTPTPTPLPTVTPPTPPAPTPNGPPSVLTTIAANPYIITTGTAIDSGLQTVTKAGVTDSGALYRGSALDGSASSFFFPTASSLDATTTFDTRFGVNGEPAFPTGGIAGFRFSSLQIGGTPNFNATGGVTDLALVGMTGITSNGLSGIWNLGGLRSLFMGTDRGSIYLSDKPDFIASSGSGFKFLEFFAREGSATFSSTIDTPTADLLISASNNTVLAKYSELTVKDATLYGGSTVQLYGKVSSNSLNLRAGFGVSVGGDVTSGNIQVNAPYVALNGDITATSLVVNGTTAILPFGTGSEIRAGNITLNSGGMLALNPYDAKSGSFPYGIDFGSVSNFTATAQGLLMTGSIKLPTTVDASLVLGAGGINAPLFSLTGIKDLTITGGNLVIDDLHSKGNVTVSGNVTGREVGALNMTVGGAINLTGKLETFKEDDMNALHTYTATSISAAGSNSKGAQLGIVYDGRAGTSGVAPTRGGRVELHANTIDFDSSSGAINGATLSGGSGAGTSYTTPGGDGGELSVGSDATPIPGPITVKAPITATTGINGRDVTTGGAGGTVNLVSNDLVRVESAIKVSSSTTGSASRSGGNIKIDSRRTTGTAINVNSSGQLLALLAAAAPGPGGKIEFISAGGDIRVNGGKLQADKGTVDIRNSGPAGRIELTNADIRGDVVKVGALGPNGELRIGGGTINADTSLKLYGGTSNGQVRFTDNVTLGGAGAKIIAGKTVRIDDGRVVTVGGSSPANVHTDNPQYTGSGGNGSTSGQFGGAGANTQSYGSAPGF